MTQQEILRMGRLGMGWSEAALARTVAVPEQTVRDWESGSRPIPANVIAWVGMYARRAETANDSEPDQSKPAAA